MADRVSQLCFCVAVLSGLCVRCPNLPHFIHPHQALHDKLWQARPAVSPSHTFTPPRPFPTYGKPSPPNPADNDNYSAPPPTPPAPFIPDHLLPEEQRLKSRPLQEEGGEEGEGGTGGTGGTAAVADSEPGDMAAVYRRWDHLSHQSIDLQEELTQV